MVVFRALSSNCHEAGGREVALAGPNCYCGTPVLQLMSFTLVTPREQTLTRFEIISAENHLQIMADTRSKKEEIFMDVVYVVTTFNSEFLLHIHGLLQSKHTQTQIHPLLHELKLEKGYCSCSGHGWSLSLAVAVAA